MTSTPLQRRHKLGRDHLAQALGGDALFGGQECGAAILWKNAGV